MVKRCIYGWHTECVNAAKLKPHFPEFCFLQSFRLVWAKGEICTRLGRQNVAVDRRSVLDSNAAPAHCYSSSGSPGWPPATPAPTPSPPWVWLLCSVRKDPVSSAGHLLLRGPGPNRPQTAATTQPRGLRIPVLAYPVGSRIAAWVLAALALIYFTPTFSCQLTVLLLRVLAMHTEVADFHVLFNQLPHLHSTNHYSKSFII